MDDYASWFINGWGDGWSDNGWSDDWSDGWDDDWAGNGFSPSIKEFRKL